MEKAEFTIKPDGKSELSLSDTAMIKCRREDLLCNICLE